ncbi:MAG: helix-turn-helix domain-containing protein [Caldilineaceae bacterium]|nr:helix-turn-helix domain-containing protein [Caldilineaceae bacterium]
MTDRPWTVSELADTAGVNASYVRRLCQSGTLAGSYLAGKTWLIPREAGDQWLADRRKRFDNSFNKRGDV